jgi:3-methyladenine DNA glycosylase AlkD
MVSVEEVLKRLESKTRRDQLVDMARYGMNVERRLGVSIPELRTMAKDIGKDHGLALGLWKTGVADAKILAAMVDDPEQLSEEQMEATKKIVELMASHRTIRDFIMNHF